MAASSARRGHVFPAGPGGVCHPLNIAGFDVSHPDCEGLYRESAQMLYDSEMWGVEVGALGSLARQAWNCSTVQECGLAGLFLQLAKRVCPGFDPSEHNIRGDRFAWAMQARMGKRVREGRTRELHVMMEEHSRELQAAAGSLEPGKPVSAGDVTLGIHADPKSAAGLWRGQLELWRAYAGLHGLRWRLDTEVYFDGVVFAEYGRLFWAAESGEHRDFWKEFMFLKPTGPGRGSLPEASWAHANLRDQRLLQGLAVFTQPPSMWDSLEAFSAAVPENKWTIWMDYDLTISPCCFREFSFLELINGWEGNENGGTEPHVIVRDSPSEDYLHHCANAGFIAVRNSAIGRLFLELARQKRQWPAIPYGYQGALAESLLELLGFEKKLLGHRGAGYSSSCLPYLTIGKLVGGIGYADFCLCWRSELHRLAGPVGARTSSWVRFLEPRRGPETGLLLASLFLFRSPRDSDYVADELAPQDRLRGVGYLPLTSWSRERHRSYADAWLVPDATSGGPCAMMPLMQHWASLPHRPQLLYDFMHQRFPEDLPLAVLVNGSAEELASAYLAAGARGQAKAQAFLQTLSTSGDPIRRRLQRTGCGLGSWQMWAVGGFTRSGRTTTPKGPHHHGGR